MGRDDKMKTMKEVIKKTLPVWIKKPLGLTARKLKLKVQLFNAIEATVT